MSFREVGNEQFVADDPVAPNRIEHCVDEILFPPAPQSYNYIRYHFQVENEMISARTYLDNIEEVSVFISLEKKTQRNRGYRYAFYDNVLLYLSRRFAFIKILSENGYELVWQSKPVAAE